MAAAPRNGATAAHNLMLNTYTTIGTSGSPSTTAFWIDLLNPTAEETARVEQEFALKVPSRESLQEIESSSRLKAEGQVLYASMPLAVQYDATSFAPVPLGFILSPKLLITVRYSEVHAFAQVQARVNKDFVMGSTAAFAALIDGMVDFSADVLEKLSSELAAISARAFGEPSVSTPRNSHARSLRESLKAIGIAGDHLSRIRESLMGLQRIIGFICDMAADWLAPELRTRLRTQHQDLNSLVDFEAHLSGKTQFLLDAILGFINTEQNDIFKVLTIVSVVGIPPTLIASMYGMNFHNMPELGWRWGYPYGLALIVVSIILPILWFKRRGWW
jgi:magnesium transporter